VFKTFKQGVVGGLVTLAAGLAAPGAQADDTGYQALDQRIQSLEQQLQTLEAAKPANSDASNASVSIGQNGLAIKSADGQYTLNFHALVQLDGRFFPDAPGTQGLLDTFTLRRVEPSFEGNLTSLFSYKIMPEFGGSPTSTVTADLYGEFHFQPKYFNVRVGKYKEPVGLENLQGSANLAFVERGLPTDLIPNRDLGVDVNGVLGNNQLSYTLGVFNGAPDGADANATDPDNHKEFAGRLFAQPWHDGKNGALDNLGFGISGSAGREDSLSTTYASSPTGTLGTNGILPQYKTPGQNTFFQYGSTATPVGADGLHDRLSPQAYYYYGGFSALAEYVVTHQQLDVFAKPKDSGDVTNKARELTVGYLLTGENASYNGVNPINPFGAGAGWGAFEVVARAGELQVGNDAYRKFADGNTLAAITTAASQAKSQGIGLNWYLTKNIKTQFDYDETHFTGGAVGGNRPVEHALLARAQYNF